MRAHPHTHIALSFSHASEFAPEMQWVSLPHVQELPLQRGQCVRVINPYPDHRSVADALADSYDLGVGVLVSVDKLLKL